MRRPLSDRIMCFLEWVWAAVRGFAVGLAAGLPFLLLALLLMAMTGCSYAHSHPRLDGCHAHASAPGHSVHDHEDSGGFIEDGLYVDGEWGVGVNGPCQEES